MQLTVLGCAGTFPSAESGCSAYLLRHEGYSLLVDVGNGAVGALQRATHLLDVDAVLLSHLHADHCVDLAAYSYARRFHPNRPGPVPVYGPAGTPERLGRIFDRPPKDGLRDVYDFRLTGPGRLSLGPFDVELNPTAHPIECYSVRASVAGRTVVYSADTGPTPHIVHAARGADLFLCEASWLGDEPRPPDLHMTARQAGEHAAAAEVDRLLLVHTQAYVADQQRYVEEAAQAFPGDLALARAGATYDV